MKAHQNAFRSFGPDEYQLSYVWSWDRFLMGTFLAGFTFLMCVFTTSIVRHMAEIMHPSGFWQITNIFACVVGAALSLGTTLGAGYFALGIMRDVARSARGYYIVAWQPQPREEGKQPELQLGIATSRKFPVTERVPLLLISTGGLLCRRSCILYPITPLQGEKFWLVKDDLPRVWCDIENVDSAPYMVVYIGEGNSKNLPARILHDAYDHLLGRSGQWRPLLNQHANMRAA